MTAPSRTSVSARVSGERWPMRWPATTPIVVAESLRAVEDPLAAALVAPAPAPAAAVARGLVRALAPAEAAVPLAPWLWPEQRRTVRRVAAAVIRFGGALLADPVGSGKSYVALAVAWALARDVPPTCFVPAALAAQWQALGARLGVPLVVWSQERVSRGTLPPSGRGVVIVDESHRFRHADTRRHHHLACWLGGRPTLLLSATPAVNATSDVAHQLLLAVRGDALAVHGVRSLSSALEGDAAPAALGHVVLASAGPRRPERIERAVAFEAAAWLHHAVRGIDRLRLSDAPPIAALLRGLLLRAAASSPAALLGAATRYRRLLSHAADAAAAGTGATRAALRALISGQEDQLLLWPMLAPLAGSDGSDLSLDDVASLDELIALAREALSAPDPKLDALHAVLAVRRPTLVFTAARDTVRYLRERLAGHAVAWCTGERAGLGHSMLARDVVVGWFRREPRGAVAPSDLLVATDVAAEGLDLARVERVVHYDLPWTAVRLEQREGRARRAGAAHAAVEAVELRAPAIVARRLRQRETIDAKARLPERLGVAADGRWRWRADLAERASGERCEGRAVVRAAGAAGALIGVALEAVGQRERRSVVLAHAVLWVGDDGATSEDRELVEPRLREALGRECDRIAAPVSNDDAAAWIARAVPAVRARLRAIEAARWGGEGSGPARMLVERLQRLARGAARRRDRALLTALERALRFAAGGHTAGEAALAEALARVDDRALLAAVATLPAPSPDVGAVAARITGLIVFRAGGAQPG